MAGSSICIMPLNSIGPCIGKMKLKNINSTLITEKRGHIHKLVFSMHEVQSPLNFLNHKVDNVAALSCKPPPG